MPNRPARPPTRITDELRAAILADIREPTLSRAQIAAKHGVSKTTVGAIAQRAGVTRRYGRGNPPTENLARGRAAYIEERLAQLGADFADAAGRLLADAFSEYDHLATSAGGPEIIRLKLPPARDRQALVTSAAVGLDKAAKVADRIRTAEQGGSAEQVGSLLGAMFAQLQAEHGTGQ